MLEGLEGLETIAAWYEEHTGHEVRSRASGRLLKIASYLKSTGKSLDDVEMIPNQDRAWNTRRNRSEVEKSAVCIGSTGQAKRLTYWWLMARETATAAK